MLANCGGIYNLRDLQLSNVTISKDVIEFMLACFPLERICIGTSYVGQLSLSGGTVSRLKTLELFECCVDLKLSASSLTLLTFTGPERKMVLEHVPNLSDLSIDEEFCTTFLQRGFANVGYISQLKRLHFAMSKEVVRESINFPLDFPQTLNLEELKVELVGEEDCCFLWPVLLIQAAPFLRKFTAKIRTTAPERRMYDQLYEQRVVDLRNAAKRVQYHQYLKRVELHDYYGEASEVELVEHLLGVSDVLEQIGVAPFFTNDFTWGPTVRVNAYARGMKIPPSSKAKLVVL